MLTDSKSRKPHKKGLTPTQRRNRLWGLALISPWLIGMLGFKLAPVVATLILSFTNYPLLDPVGTEFIGLTNFINVFTDPKAWNAFFQTISLALIIIPVQITGSILFATILSHKGLKMKNTLRSLFFLPSIIPSVAAMFMFQGFLDPDIGWLDRLFLGPIGLGGLIDIYSADGVRTMFIVTSLWSIGPGFLIMMSALQSIPDEIHEAAQLDGANVLQHFFGITIPIISPAIFFSLVLNLTVVFGGAALYNPGDVLSTAASSLDGYLHYAIFDLQKLGYASSVSWTFFMFVMVIVLTLFGTAKYWVYFPDAERQL